MNNRVSKIESNQVFHCWDLTQDGRFPNPRWKGKDKDIRNRARRRSEKNQVRKEIFSRLAD